MEAKQKQGLIIGLAVGIALFAFFYASTHAPICFILIPVGAVMGIAPQLIKPLPDDNDDRFRHGSSHPRVLRGPRSSVL